MPPSRSRLLTAVQAKVLAAAALVLVFAVPPARADVVVTTDGRTLEGKVLSQDATEVVIETTFDGTHRLPRPQVKSVDTTKPPLREQWAFRAEAAKGDAAKLWEMHRWATEKGFKAELAEVLEWIIQANPEDRKARKALGHEKVDGKWMTPEEKTRHVEEKNVEAMKAKGLVLHEGRWVTPQEKDALEKGLVKDGDDWVTEDVFHQRRGETKKDGQWIKVGQAEGLAYAEAAGKGAGITMALHWTAHFDVVHDGMAETAQKVGDAAEAMFAKVRKTFQATEKDLKEGVDGRIRIVLFRKQPAYARYVKWFDETAKASEIVPNWGRMSSRQHAFWWAHPERVVAVYQFPNTERTFVSNALHNVGLVLLTRYRLNYRFPTFWLQEGFAYWLEMEVLKYTESFTLGRAGGASVAAGGSEGQPPAWGDSRKWRSALKALVNEGRDPPLKRMAAMTGDQMGYEDLVKSWSVIEYLIKTDAAKFKAFVDGSKEKGVEEEKAFKDAFGGGYREIDEKWKAHVLAEAP